MRIERSHSRIGGPEAWTIWVLATVFVVWLFAIQTGHGIVSPDIQRDVHLTISQVAVAASVYSWVFAVVQFFSGALLDRFGARPLLAISVGLVTAGAFLYAATVNVGTLVLAEVVLAVGASFGFVGAGYVGGKWFVAARYGLMFALVETCASVGSAISQPGISLLLTVVSWQQLLAGFGAFGVLLTVGFVVIVRNPGRTAGAIAGAQSLRPGASLLAEILSRLGFCVANSRVVWSALFAGASFGTMLAVGVLWGPRVQQAHGVSPAAAATLTAAAWLGLAVGAPLVNVLSDHFHNRSWPALIGLILQAVAVTVFIYGPTGGAASVVVMFGVGLFAGTHMLGFTIAGESVSPTLIGSASAIVNGCCFIVGGLLVAIPSYLLPDAPTLADFRSALWIMPVTLLLGALCTLGLPGAISSRRQPPPRPLHNPVC